MAVKRPLMTMAATALTFGVLGPTAAQAQDAYTTTDLNMRAGPNTQFPVVTTIPQGGGVTIHGCVSGYDWCDVTWRGRRGWAFSDYLDYAYQGSRRPLPEIVGRIDLPIISFQFGTYWDRHYRDSPWYDARDRWRDRWDGDDDRDRDRDRDWDDDRDDDDDDRGRGGDRDRDRDDDDRGRGGDRDRDRDDDDRGRGGDRDRDRDDDDRGRGGDRDRDRDDDDRGRGGDRDRDRGDDDRGRGGDRDDERRRD